MYRSKTWKVLVALILSGLTLFSVAVVFMPLPVEKLHPQQAYRFYDRDNQLIMRIISEDGFYRMHIPYEQLSPLFIKALLLHEDQYFYQHPGINPLAIFRAMIQNISNGRIISGGSTLTMQLARMLDRRPRTLYVKLIETVRAIQLELKYSKDEIMAYYLALAPYGGNLEGVQAASYAYFNKPAHDLSISEAALLVALPKSPNRFRPDRHPQRARDARDEVLQRLLKGELITADQYQRALLEEVPVKRYPVENLIPHTAWHYRLKQPDKYVWHTTIDGNMQRLTQQLLRKHMTQLREYNISNAAAVVIDNKTGEVRATVGSLDYFSEEALGANDGCRIARSPGSTLKPFLYGMAMQEGLVAEKTVLYDIPVNYGGYSPQNYSREFSGLVTVREALTESLNIPAVRLSQQLGVKKLHQLLQDGGLTTVQQPSHYYGLPLVLGGVEARLLELTNLYAALANGGKYRPYSLIRGFVEGAPERQLISPEATWLITHILTDVSRPDFPESWQFSKNRPTVAWKTGTSYGHQDAWSIGYTPELTIGIWVGNFDASPSAGLIGNQAAAPLLFDVFQALQPKHSNWFKKPDAVKKRMVCATCGKLPTKYCQQMTSEYYIENAAGRIQHELCEVPQPILIDKRTGVQASADTPVTFTEQKVFNIWPSEVASYLFKSGRPVRDAPPYIIKNMAGQKYYPPTILSPVERTLYVQRPDRFDLADHGIKLEVGTTNRIRKVFWFLNETLVAEGDPADPVFINPAPGTYQVKVMDEVGGTDEVKLIIRSEKGDKKDG